ncbi:MAG: FAD-binding protein [Thermodesulfobacteriota bacterium]|nr:FAD-binding protein [Thermodesulfobacteriota bacterium]
MTFTCQEQKTCDVLVIGGGGAGLRAAIAAASAGADVLMVSKTRMGYASNTYLSKAIVASSGWGTPEDSSDVHKEDTRAGGRYLNDPEMVARFTEKIRSETRQLMAWGAAFGCDEGGIPKVLKVPGHTYARHLFGKNLKGSDLALPLRRKALEKGVRFQERYFVTSLLLSKREICGATAVSLDGGKP